MPPAPPVLYKYYTPERIDFFDNWTVRFSNPESFNDAFDSNWSAVTFPERRERAKFRSGLGVLCTTVDPDNHLMWVHYAAQHAGFVIGFKTDSDLFKDGGDLREVRYEQPPPSITPPSMDLCWSKDPDWSREKEWRCIRKIGHGNARDVPLEPEWVSEIILGSAMAGAHINAVLECMEWLRPEFKVQLCQSKVDLVSRRIVHEASKSCAMRRMSGQGANQHMSSTSRLDRGSANVTEMFSRARGHGFERAFVFALAVRALRHRPGFQPLLDQVAGPQSGHFSASGLPQATKSQSG